MSAFNGIKFVRRMFGVKDRVTPDGRTIGEVIADVIVDVVGRSAVVWDGFIGSGYCGMVFKRRGLSVVSSDVRPSPWLRGMSLVHANSPALSAEVIEAIAKAAPKADGWFVRKEAALIGARNAGWLDALAETMPSLDEGGRIAATLGVVWATETFLQKGSRFLHMHRSWDGETLCGGWHMRDKDLAVEWRRFMLEDYPRLVHDNGRDNPCLFGDAVGLAPNIKADAAYFDPPYSGLFSSYRGSYDIVDDWTKALLGDAMPPEPTGQPHRRFSSPDNAIPSLALLMDRSRHIPLWIISYSDADTMGVLPEDIQSLAEAEGRSVEIIRFPFRQSCTKKLAVPKTFNECLIICRDGTKGGAKITMPSSIEVIGHDVDPGPSGDPAPSCVSLFSGIGGTDLALLMAGFRCLLACEKDELARKANEANFGHAPHSDVLTLDLRDVPLHDLLAAGWPCQDLSIGGKHLGMAGEKCRLALEIIRIADGARPKAILLENSNTLPTHDDGKLLKDLLSRFAAIGYRGWWRILDACDFGLPTLRKRTYVVLFREDLDIKGFDFPKPFVSNSCLLDVLLPDNQTDHLVLRRPDIIIDPDAVARAERDREHYTMRVGRVREEVPARQGARIYSPYGCAATICSGGGGLGANTGLYLINGKVRPLHPRECARALGFPDSFLLPDSENEALKLIGNSVAIPVVAMIAKEIARTLGFRGRGRGCRC